MKKEKHCDKCSYTTEEGLAISGCAYCGCHNKNMNKNLNELIEKELEKNFENKFGDSPRTKEEWDEFEDVFVSHSKKEEVKGFIRQFAQKILGEVKEENKKDIDLFIKVYEREAETFIKGTKVIPVEAVQELNRKLEEL